MKIGKKQAGAEMCQAYIKLWFDFEWHGIVWFGLVGYGLAWFGIPLKLNYQVSLLALDGGVDGIKSKLRLNPAWAELGNFLTHSII